MSPGSCPRKAWAETNGGVFEAAPFPPERQKTERKTLSQPNAVRTAWQLSSICHPLSTRCSPALPCSRRTLCSAAPVATSLGFPPEGKGRARGCGLRLRRPGATPAAEVTVGEVGRGHELLHPLKSGAPMFQERRYRHGDAPTSLLGRSLVLPARCTA